MAGAGREIANSGQVVRLDENTYKVNSQSGAGQDDVLRTETGWFCSCKDYEYRQLTCKHIYGVAVQPSLQDDRRI